MKQLFLTLLTLSSLVLVSCSPKSNSNRSWLETLREDVGIFSNRPQTNDRFIAILKFKTPPLLASAVVEDGRVRPDPAQLKAISDEQNQALADLKKLSPDIQIVYRYKMVVNGVAIIAPNSLLEKIRGLGTVAYAETSGNFSRPTIPEGTASQGAEDILAANSVKWIGADKLHEKQITGRGIKVGIIDTGIDYTHSMLGGPGSEDLFKSIDPSKPSLLFPNKKVVGGIDLVGTKYDSASGDFSRHIPIPDDNPLDEGGHGSHVAGTVAGIGDGVNTYSGVAPDAELFAIKVFGAEGSTGDAVVIAGLEYAADPTGQGTGEGRLDVVNMSLGSPWGVAHVMYGQAIQNLVHGGTIVVASAGNSGALDYIVGSPSVNDEALSVAASIDNSSHNWKFAACKFKTPNHGEIMVEAIEGSVSKPVQEGPAVSGALVYVGLADADFSAEVKDQVKGHVALIDRGKVPFADKVRRAAEAGAIGVVVANNQPGDAFQMGGEGRWEIPAIMVTQAMGDILKSELKVGAVLIDFQTPEKIEKPELIDTLTSFSSKGPRSIDGILKPEISAPGANVISAAMGKGNKGVQFSGTSMSSPHMAGAMALLRQAFPALSVAELKSMAMGRSLSLQSAKKELYPVSAQGAGRIQVDRAAASPVVANVTSLSMGVTNLEAKKVMRRKFTLKNISKETQSFGLEFVANSPHIKMTGPSQVVISMGETVTVTVNFVLDATQMKETIREMDGWLKLTQSGQEAFRIPVMALAHRISQVRGTELVVRSTSEADSAGAAAELTINNAGVNPGDVLVFNLLGKDERKQAANNDPYLSKSCDLQAAGYRVLDKLIDGQKIRVLQVAVKLYEPLTTWNTCQVSMLIDANGDGKADQELAGVTMETIKGLANGTNSHEFASILLDAAKARELRKQFEIASQGTVDPQKKPEENYTSAVIDLQAMKTFSNSTIAVIEADVSKLARSASGQLAIKVATIHDEASSAEADDYLAGGLNKWTRISVQGETQSFLDLPEVVTLAPSESRTLDLTKGEGLEGLLLLMPQNRTVFSDLQKDSESQILKARYRVP